MGTFIRRTHAFCTFFLTKPWPEPKMDLSLADLATTTPLTTGRGPSSRRSNAIQMALDNFGTPMVARSSGGSGGSSGRRGRNLSEQLRDASYRGPMLSPPPSMPSSAQPS